MFTETEEIRSQSFAFFLERKYMQSIQECVKAITVSPSSSWCYYLMGVCFFRLGKFTYAYAYLNHFMDMKTPRSQESERRARVILRAILKKSNIQEGEYRSRHARFPDA